MPTASLRLCVPEARAIEVLLDSPLATVVLDKEEVRQKQLGGAYSKERGEAGHQPSLQQHGEARVTYG